MSGRFRVPAKLAVGLAAILLLGAASTASAKERCCFKVTVEASGVVRTNYQAPTDADGFRPIGSTEGPYEFDWRWETRQLAHYKETGDRRRPFLVDRCLGRRCLESPHRLFFFYGEAGDQCEWQSPQDTDGDGTDDSQSCVPPYNLCDRNYTISTNGRFVDPRSPGRVNFARPLGFTQLHALAYGISGGAPRIGRGIKESGDRCSSVAGPFDHNPFAPDIDSRNFLFCDAQNVCGPFEYTVNTRPPSRRDFLRGERFGTGTFQLAANHGLSGCQLCDERPHTLTSSGRFKISFTHFPQRRLGREIRRLRNLE